MLVCPLGCLLLAVSWIVFTMVCINSRFSVRRVLVPLVLKVSLLFVSKVLAVFVSYSRFGVVASGSAGGFNIC